MALEDFVKASEGPDPRYFEHVDGRWRWKRNADDYSLIIWADNSSMLLLNSSQKEIGMMLPVIFSFEPEQLELAKSLLRNLRSAMRRWHTLTEVDEDLRKPDEEFIVVLPVAEDKKEETDAVEAG